MGRPHAQPQPAAVPIASLVLLEGSWNSLLMATTPIKDFESFTRVDYPEKGTLAIKLVEWNLDSIIFQK